jgi:ArsR family transcriptional regulator, arsenate/arsenite/antimonite-responsive transcriptional repressor
MPVTEHCDRGDHPKCTFVIRDELNIAGLPAPLDPSRKLVISRGMTTATRVDTERAAQLFHALSDQIRLEVVALLVGGERCVCDLMADMDLAQSRLSWHLKTLSDAGIISGRREGRWNYYSLNREALSEAKELLDSLKPTRRLSVRANCC